TGYFLKYKTLHHQAKHIDRLIDHELHVRGGMFLTPEQLQTVVTTNYPDFYVENCGWHKTVFRNLLSDHKVVLKIGPRKSIENDHHAYKQVPESMRHLFFAKIYWHTKYCLLQEFGDQTPVTLEQLNCVRAAVYKYGVFDIKADNLRWIDGELKIIDANATRIPLPTVLRKMDEIKPKLPKKLETWLKKITKQLYRT
ncbi:MAG TPA: hypothetical protein VLH35_00375, partial [Candidatus Acidoferrales bacterium]|nr:hypothetical protein [Candidatus Acidoferrales bacterium]